MTPCSISIHEELLASYAYEEALKSPCLHRHGCVATVNGKIIARGYNNYQVSYKKNPIIRCDQCSCHAEIDAIRKIYRLHTKGGTGASASASASSAAKGV